MAGGITYLKYNNLSGVAFIINPLFLDILGSGTIDNADKEG